MIIVYSDNISNRLNYTLNVLFKKVLKVDYKLVDLKTFNNCKNKVKINYSYRALSNCISIKPHTILFENNLKKHLIKVDWLDRIPYYFKTSDTADFNYDIFASTFYIVTRYEEYFTTKLDNHNRFKAEDSVAYKNNFLEIPVANIWAQELKKEIIKKYPNSDFPILKYNFINSIDIDVAYAYKGKGFFRFVGGFIKSIMQLNLSEVKNRCNYIYKNKDLYNTYAKIIKLQTQFNTKNFFFINLGDYAKFDKNISYKKKALNKLIEQLISAPNTTIGVHPSYASNKDFHKIKLEKERLENIIKKKVTKSRQHYIMLEYPDTYQQLIKYNIEEDYTMGFASKVGFRAGICTSYPFFDILNNKEQKLLITPFQIMDGTLNHYENLTKEQATKKINNIITAIKNVNGTFVSLWHNTSLSEVNEWTGWTLVYEALIKNATKK